MEELTVILLTTNRVPQSWVSYHKSVLLDAIGDSHLITISRIPMPDMPGLNLIQSEPFSSVNIYYQLLRGAKEAITKYIAVAEDDTLYTKEHFSFIPPDDAFAYNMHRWSLYTWNPIYSLKNFIRTNAVLIATKDLIVEALSERFAKYPMGTSPMPYQMAGELGRSEKPLGVTLRKSIDFKTEDPVVQFDHPWFTGHDNSPDSMERRKKKLLGTIKAFDIPVWGRADELVKRFI